MAVVLLPSEAAEVVDPFRTGSLCLFRSPVLFMKTAFVSQDLSHGAWLVSGSASRRPGAGSYSLVWFEWAISCRVFVCLRLCPVSALSKSLRTCNYPRC